MVSGFGDRLNEFGMSFEIELFAGLVVSSESALAAGLVMGMMIMPFILSLSDDVISAVPDSLRDGSIAMGSTKSETVWKVVFPAALPGIVGGFLLAISRAIGETMIVLMAAGVAANLTANPLNSVTTVTTQIVVLLTGDQEFDSIKTLSAFALATWPFCNNTDTKHPCSTNCSKIQGSSMNNLEIVKAGLNKRYAKERRFKFYGIFSISREYAFFILSFV